MENFKEEKFIELTALYEFSIYFTAAKVMTISGVTIHRLQ